MGVKKAVTLSVIVLSSFIFLALLVKYTRSCSCLSSFLFPSLDLKSEDSQWGLLLRSTLLYVSCFLFGHTALVMFSRMFSGRSSPATKQDPTYIKLLNRIITNSIEQSAIFLGLFYYFVTDGPVSRLDSLVVVNLCVWFLLGRVLFSLGYILGTMIDLPQLRTFGFALSVFVNVFLIEQIFLPSPVLSTFFLKL